MDISIRGTKGLGNSAVLVTWRSATMTNLGTPTYLTEIADSDAFESAYYVSGVTPPTSAVTFDITVESTGRVWASGLVADYTSFTPSQVEALVSVGNWLRETDGGGSYVLPVMTGSVYTATATQRRSVVIVQGDTPTITFALSADYTGWDPWFGAAGAAAITPRLATWVDEALGQGSVALSAIDTATSGHYEAEIELRNGAKVLTAIKFKLEIIPQIITV